MSVGDIDSKSIAVYITTKESPEADGSSLPKLKFATGLASGLERNLGLGEGAVYVLHHYPEPATGFYSMDYIQSLSRQADSDMVIIVEDIRISDFTRVSNVAVSSSQVQYMHALFEGVLSAYDGTTAEQLTQKVIRDTIYWEVITNSSSAASSSGGIEAAVNAISSRIGNDVSDTFFPTWSTEPRYLYVHGNQKWAEAYRQAKSFRWERAINIWSAELNQSDKYKAACAAINIAVGCEMTGRAELALDWLNVAEKTYKAEALGLDSYKLRLRQIIEKGKK